MPVVESPVREDTLARSLQGFALCHGVGDRRLSEVIDESARAAMQMVAGGQQQASGVEQIALAM